MKFKDLDEPVAQALEREFGYVPDEESGEKWAFYGNHSLIVIHHDRKPRIYKRGCGGKYYEIEPM